MLKPHVVEQPPDGSTLPISAAYSDIPIAVGMRPRVAHAYLAQCALSCLRGAASLTNKAGDKQFFEGRGSHAPA